MKQRTRTVVSGVCGIVAAVSLALFLHQTATASERAKAQLLNRFGGSTAEVLVATKTIYAGEKVVEGSIASQNWPSILLPEDPYLRSESNKVIGHSANSIILAGEPLRVGRIDEAASILESVPIGMQAVTIPTDPIRALGGAVRVGMRVDLLCPNTTGTMEVLARDVVVLALSTEDSGEEAATTTGLLGAGAAQDIRWITVCVEGELAQQVVTAATIGKVYLTYSGQAYEG
ncbi:MAG: RcpC/CpaB family pilus assembly protein [Actinomycetia bacterium]|nr:RcpC/CpaB family pilus assembly protein [Actinomycetes bacterium]